MTIEQIKWIDATGDDGWITKQELKHTNLTPFDTVGYLFSEDKDCVKLVMSYDEDSDNYGAFMVIPKGMIIKRTVIKK